MFKMYRIFSFQVEFKKTLKHSHIIGAKQIWHVDGVTTIHADLNMYNVR